MYILVKSDQTTVYPYSFHRLCSDNRNTSFRPDMSDAELATWGMFPVTYTPVQEYDPELYKVIEDAPIFVDGGWLVNRYLTMLDQSALDSIARAKQEVINITSREYLASTDWYAIRKAETGVEIPEDILIKRSDARASIIEV